jgi:hypothetical protein
VRAINDNPNGGFWSFPTTLVWRTSGKLFSKLPDSKPLQPAISKKCKRRVSKDPQLAMIGYSVPPAAKRQVWAEVRERCKAPILELHKNEEPSIMADAFFHQVDRPDDLLAALRRILKEAS